MNDSVFTIDATNTDLLSKLGCYESFLEQNYKPFLDLYVSGNKDAIQVLSYIIRYNFNAKLASELLSLARKHKNLKLDGLDLERRVAEWVRSLSPPNLDLALALLDSKHEIVQNVTAAWIISKFDLEEKLFQPLLFSSNPTVVERGKLWFKRNRGTMGKYLIRKNSGQINILKDGKNIDLEELPLHILNAILSIPCDVVLQAQKVILNSNIGVQLLIDDLYKICDNNIQQMIVSIEKRRELLDVLADLMGWNDIQNNIISYKVLENVLD